MRLWALFIATCSSSALAEDLSFIDPAGDDDGGGKLEYPTDTAYAKGAFDIVKLDVREDGDDVVFEIHLTADVTDPWTSKDWGGNGFSLQFVQIYLDLDGKKRSGERWGLPGSWIEFQPEGYYEKVVLVAPHPSSKLEGEVAQKAKAWKDKVVLPSRTEARRKSLVARVPKKAIGAPSKKWGVQAAMMSAEGFPAPDEVMARKVNEYAGQHKFGGGCDGYGDAQVADILAGKAKGDASEVKEQHTALSSYTCSDDPKKAKAPRIAMVRP
jgi:carbohydrate-binding DOMON domain-containing protein